MLFYRRQDSFHPQMDSYARLDMGWTSRETCHSHPKPYVMQGNREREYWGLEYEVPDDNIPSESREIHKRVTVTKFLIIKRTSMFSRDDDDCKVAWRGSKWSNISFLNFFPHCLIFVLLHPREWFERSRGEERTLLLKINDFVPRRCPWQGSPHESNFISRV